MPDGSGCGTKPTRARWTIDTQSGTLPKSPLIIDFLHANKNPAEVVDSHYSGTPQASIKFFLTFTNGKSAKATLSAQTTGPDVVGPTFNPATTAITAKKVKKC